MAEFEFEHLRVAFAYHMVEQIVHADDAVEFKETDFMERHFPSNQLLKYGFIEESGNLTQRFSDGPDYRVGPIPPLHRAGSGGGISRPKPPAALAI